MFFETSDISPSRSASKWRYRLCETTIKRTKIQGRPAKPVDRTKNTAMRLRKERLIPNPANVPYSADCLNSLLARTVIQLLPQIVDVDIDNGGIGIEMNIPYMFDDTGSGTDLSFVVQKKFQKREFSCREKDLSRFFL